MSNVLDLRTAIANSHNGPCAEVRVGEHVTRYVRRGSGPSVLLLGAEADSNAIWGPLVDSLCGRHRLVVPRMPAECVDSTLWLRGFIEGVGLTSVVIVAGPRLAHAAYELATADEFTVSKLVVLPDDESLPASPSSRILCIQRSSSPRDAVQEIEEFLRAG